MTYLQNDCRSGLFSFAHLTIFSLGKQSNLKKKALPLHRHLLVPSWLQRGSWRVLLWRFFSLKVIICWFRADLYFYLVSGLVRLGFRNNTGRSLLVYSLWPYCLMFQISSYSSVNLVWPYRTILCYSIAALFFSQSTRLNVKKKLGVREKVVSVAREPTCLTSDMEIKGDFYQNEFGSLTYRPASLSLFFFFLHRVTKVQCSAWIGLVFILKVINTHSE